MGTANLVSAHLGIVTMYSRSKYCNMCLFLVVLLSVGRKTFTSLCQSVCTIAKCTKLWNSSLLFLRDTHNFFEDMVSHYAWHLRAATRDKDGDRGRDKEVRNKIHYPVPTIPGSATAIGYVVAIFVRSNLQFSVWQCSIIMRVHIYFLINKFSY